MQNTPISGKVILVGNPNVGKSTLFNLLTGKKVHTGNWSGKTVTVSEGYGVHMNKKLLYRDLPGISSLSNPTGEEISAFTEITSGDYNACIIVADATNLTKSLSLTLRVLELTPRAVLCLNMWDETEKQGISIDINALAFMLGIRVIPICAQKKSGITQLLNAVIQICDNDFSQNVFTPLYSEETEHALSSFSYDRGDTLKRVYSSPGFLQIKSDMAQQTAILAYKIKQLTQKSVPHNKIRLDRIFCSPYLGFPIMLLLVGIILFLTIVVSNYPSALLSELFSAIETKLLFIAAKAELSPFLSSFLITGIYKTAATVIAVMLPPMVIFFPFFALLEDSGYLPRVAFNLDGAFSKCGSCGKMALSCCMGLGCNCVGISNSAIIPSPKQRIIAIITNSFTPCNGRFGAIIACICIFITPQNSVSAAIVMSFVLIFSLFATLLASRLLSSTILKEQSSPFILDLPSYRMPRFFHVIKSSLGEHAPSILIRAVMVAAPMGGAICILNHFNLLLPIARFLDPFASLIGLDGIILLSFILSFPANEITLPIALMLYTNSNQMVEYASYASLFDILSQNGWSVKTSVCFIVFTLLHWPCAAAVMTIGKETKSLAWTIFSVVLPFVFGCFFCGMINIIFNLIGV